MATRVDNGVTDRDHRRTGDNGEAFDPLLLESEDFPLGVRSPCSSRDETEPLPTIDNALTLKLRKHNQ